MFLAFLQDFIAYECIEGDRLINTSVTCKLECLILPLGFQSIIFEIIIITTLHTKLLFMLFSTNSTACYRLQYLKLKTIFIFSLNPINAHLSSLIFYYGYNTRFKKNVKLATYKLGAFNLLSVRWIWLGVCGVSEPA